MKINSALTQASLGIQRGISSARGHAMEIAGIGSKDGNQSSLIESMVGLKQDRLQVQASSKVLEVVDDMIGSLFDDKT